MILFFSGTGNSNYVAKRIADALGDALVNLNDRIKASDTSPVETGERVIILSLIHISEPTRQAEISYAVFCLKKKKKNNNIKKNKKNK